MNGTRLILIDLIINTLKFSYNYQIKIKVTQALEFFSRYVRTIVGAVVVIMSERTLFKSIIAKDQELLEKM